MIASETQPEKPASDMNAGEKVAKQWAQVRLAHEAVMVEDARAVLKQARQSVANLPHQLGEDMAKSAEPQDDGMIHIGDIIQYGVPDQKAESSTASVVSTAVPVAAPVAAKSSVLPSLLKIGLGAVAAGAGLGIPFAVLSGVGDLMKPAPAVVAPAEPKAEPAGKKIKIGAETWRLRLGK